MTRTIKNTRKLFFRALNAISTFYAACSQRQKLSSVGMWLAAFTSTLFASSGVNTTDGIAPWINLALTSGILIYAVKIEHRITKLEVTLELKKKS